MRTLQRNPSVDAEPPKPPGVTSVDAGGALSDQLLARYAITVPGLSRDSWERNARDYEGDKPHKAQAVSLSPPGIWRATARPSPEIAEESALENCQIFYGAPCALIVTNNSLVPVPENGNWLRRDMPRVRYAGNFDPNQIPGFAHLKQRPDLAGYAAATSPQAVAIHPTSRIFVVTGAANSHEAEERALSLCNKDPQRNGVNGDCFLYATGNQVVLPQRLRKPAS
jgi:hypothetical protein